MLIVTRDPIPLPACEVSAWSARDSKLTQELARSAPGNLRALRRVLTNIEHPGWFPAYPTEPLPVTQADVYAWPWEGLTPDLVDEGLRSIHGTGSYNLAATALRLTAQEYLRSTEDRIEEVDDLLEELVIRPERSETAESLRAARLRLRHQRRGLRLTLDSLKSRRMALSEEPAGRALTSAELLALYRDQVVPELPEDFYSSTYYADSIIRDIDTGLADGKPFFAYLAFTAPHNPLHAPDASIEKYRGVYDRGWDVLARERLRRQKESGLIAENVVAAARPNWVKAWSELTAEQQAQRARDMEVYAAMIDYLDVSIGRVLDHLRSEGEFDDTLVVFISDNGPSKTAINDYLALGGNVADFVRSFDNSLENKGRPGSSTDVGPGWAFSSATPLRLFKGYVAQRGIQVPAIVNLPGTSNGDDTRVAISAYATDLMPTFLDAAGIEYPASYRGVAVAQPVGRSLLPLLSSKKDTAFTRRGMGWEAYGMDAWRQDNWKLLRLPPPYGNGKWQLYDLARDPGETVDVSREHPGKVRELAAKWDHYARTNEVVHPDEPVFYGKAVSPGKY